MKLLKFLLASAFSVASATAATTNPHDFSTVADMVAAPAPALGDIAICAGRNAIGDGGGGIFVAQTMTTSTNLGTIFAKTNADAVKWKRDYDGPLDVRCFGAIPDDGLNDTPALQAAIDTSSHLFVPDGVYDQGGTLYFRFDQSAGTIIEGESPAAVFKGVDTTINPQIQLTSGNLRIEGLVFTNYSACLSFKAWKAAATAINLTNIVISRCKFYYGPSEANIGRMIHASTTVLAEDREIYDFTIEECYFDSPTLTTNKATSCDYIVLGANTKNLVIKDNVFVGGNHQVRVLFDSGTRRGTAGGVVPQNYYEHAPKILNNVFRDIQTYYPSTPALQIGVNWGLVSGNTFTNLNCLDKNVQTRVYGIYVQSRGTRIVNNNFTECMMGIYGKGSNPISDTYDTGGIGKRLGYDLKIENNFFRSSPTNYCHSMIEVDGDYWTIANNVFDGTGTGTTQLEFSSVGKQHDCVVEGNWFRNAAKPIDVRRGAASSLMYHSVFRDNVFEDCVWGLTLNKRTERMVFEGNIGSPISQGFVYHGAGSASTNNIYSGNILFPKVDDSATPAYAPIYSQYGFFFADAKTEQYYGFRIFDNELNNDPVRIDKAINVTVPSQAVAFRYRDNYHHGNLVAGGLISGEYLATDLANLKATAGAKIVTSGLSRQGDGKGGVFLGTPGMAGTAPDSIDVFAPNAGDAIKWVRQTEWDVVANSIAELTATGASSWRSTNVWVADENKTFHHIGQVTNTVVFTAADRVPGNLRVTPTPVAGGTQYTLNDPANASGYTRGVDGSTVAGTFYEMEWDGSMSRPGVGWYEPTPWTQVNWLTSKTGTTSRATYIVQFVAGGATPGLGMVLGINSRTDPAVQTGDSFTVYGDVKLRTFSQPKTPDGTTIFAASDRGVWEAEAPAASWTVVGNAPVAIPAFDSPSISSLSVTTTAVDVTRQVSVTFSPPLPPGVLFEAQPLSATSVRVDLINLSGDRFNLTTQATVQQ